MSKAVGDDQRLFWMDQKKACELHEADLERAGVRRRIGQPCEHDRPRMISARSPDHSGCSSAMGWD